MLISAHRHRARTEQVTSPLYESYQGSRWRRHAPLLGGLMLIPLHGALLAGPGHWAFGPLLANHLLLAVLWRFAWGDDGPAPWPALLLAPLVFAAAWWLPAWPVLLAWLCLLLGAMAYRMSQRHGTVAHLGMAAYLVATLTALMHPGLNLTQGLTLQGQPWWHGLLAAAVLAALVPAPATKPAPRPVIATSWGIAFSGMLAAAAWLLANNPPPLGEMAGLLAGLHRQWLVALVMLAMGLGLVLLLDPRGLRPGRDETPMEQAALRWTQALVECAHNSESPTRFMAQASELLAGFPGLASARWSSEGDSWSFGREAAYSQRLQHDDITLVVTSQHSLPPAEIKCLEVLLALVVELRRSKRRELELVNQSHLETIYETGARITHDVKNLLQSLQTLNTAVLASKPDQAEQIQQLMQVQMPQLTQRLRTTLEKLQAPEEVSTTFQVSRIWWAKLKARYTDPNIAFSDELQIDQLLPRDLFDRAAENLLENARRKAQSERKLTISVHLRVTETSATLTVTDSGSPIPEEVATQLLRKPIASSAGYGIALYQVATQARQHGYRLALTENKPGAVCFTLGSIANG